MEKLVCKPLFIFFLLALIRSTNAQIEPCTAMDSGSTPSAPPRLFIDVHEATQEALKSGGEKYLSEIRLHGAYGAQTPNGIQLTFGRAYRNVNPSKYFEFQHEPNSPFRNIIRLIKPIDRDGATDSVMDDTIVDSFRLKCVPFKNQTLKYWYDVALLIHDVNDNAPQLDANISYSAVVNEIIPVGSNLPIKISAKDKDSGSNRQLTYKFQDGFPLTEYLMIHNETGQVSLKKAFDYETMNPSNGLLHVPVIIHDNGKLQQLTSTATLTLQVTDGDDLGPQFSHPACQRAFGGKCFTPTYNADVNSVIKNSPILFASSGGGPLMEIRAKDGDTLAAKVDLKISAVIPGKHKSSFQLKITPPENGGDGYYTASLRLIKSIDKTAMVGTVIYITATEDTSRRHFSVARILFKGKTPVEKQAVEKAGYSSETLALIVVVAILAVVALIGSCVLIACSRSNNKKLTGHINEGMSNL